jgi:hypothetical protein
MHVAVVGSGPAGIYRVDDLVRRADLDVAVDILEQLPLLYGLVRYDVAPDHPLIKAIIGPSQRSDDPATKNRRRPNGLLTASIAALPRSRNSRGE